MSDSVTFKVPAGAEPALRGDSEMPAVFLELRIHLIKTDGSLSEAKIVSFNDVPSDWDEVKKRFRESSGGQELVLIQ